MDMQASSASGEDHGCEFAIDLRRAEFADADTERSFLDSIAASEIKDFRLAMFICGPLYLAFIVSDYLQVGDRPAIWVILAARLGVCLLALGFALRIGRGGDALHADGVATAYRASRIFFAAALGLAFVIFPLSGRSYVELYPSLIVMLMICFFFIPARFVDRLVASVLAIAGFNIEAAFWLHPTPRQLPLALLLMLATLVLGAVTVHSNTALRRQRHADSLRQRRLTERLKAEVASRERLQREALVLAHTDPLTGIANRRHFFEMAEHELTRTHRYGGPLAAMVLDIDHFKDVNDSHGHAVGDVALASVARACSAVLRATDLFGRIGGEEFAVLLPQTDVPGAAVLAERLRQAIADVRIDAPAGHVRLTATIGVSGWLEADDHLDGLLGRADQALYEGKNKGRNQVAIA